MKEQLAGVLAGIALAAGSVVATADAPAMVYVDNRNTTVTCSDSASGDAAHPFCTVPAALAAVSPGQTIVVYGTHASIAVTRSGETGKPITVRAGGPTGTTSLSIIGQHDLVVRGFGVTAPADATAVTIRDSHDVTLMSIVTHVSGSGLGYEVALSQDLLLVSLSVSGTAGRPRGMHVAAVSDSRITRFAAVGGPAGGPDPGLIDPALVLADTTQRVTVGEANIQDLHGVPIVVSGTQNSIVHSLITDSPGPGIRIQAGATGTVIARNEITGVAGDGILAAAGSDTAIANNSVRYNCLAGIHVAAEATGTSVMNNIVAYNGGYGLHCPANAAANLQVDTSATVDYNVVAANAQRLYSWNAAMLSLEQFRTQTGQGAHDLLALEDAAMTTASVDSADSAAPGFVPSFDEPYDDPAYANTGAGPVAYADRGPREIFRWPVAAATVAPTMKQIFGAREMAFDARTTTAGSAPIANYEFVFGDGTSASGPAPTVTHVYASTGVWRDGWVRATDTFGHWSDYPFHFWVPAPVKTAPCTPGTCPRKHLTIAG